MNSNSYFHAKNIYQKFVVVVIVLIVLVKLFAVVSSRAKLYGPAVSCVVILSLVTEVAPVAALSKTLQPTPTYPLGGRTLQQFGLWQLPNPTLRR